MQGSTGSAHTRTSSAPYVFSYLPPHEEINRQQLHTKVGELRGRPLNSDEIEILDKNGCIALARIMMKIGSGPRLSRLPTTPWPEEHEIKYGDRSPWKIRAFITYEQTQNFECPAGHHELIFAKWGAWKNDFPPTPSAMGEVPVDSVWGWDTPKHNSAFNYVVLVNGTWIGINHRAYDSVEQKGYIFTGPPQPNFPTTPLIFIKVCIPN